MDIPLVKVYTPSDMVHVSVPPEYPLSIPTSIPTHARFAIEKELCSHLVDGSYLWRKAAVYAQDLIVHERGKIEVVEDLDTVLPRVRVAVLAHTLLIKSVHLPKSEKRIRERQ